MMYKKKKKVKGDSSFEQDITIQNFNDEQNNTTEPVEEKSDDKILCEDITTLETICSLCGGSERYTAVAVHSLTGMKKVISIPCVCYTSKVVSMEYKLLQHLGNQYQHPDKLDPQLLLDLDHIPIQKNYLIDGSYDSFLFTVKALIMKYRFDPKRPRILFSRSIDIVHDYHVPQGDGETLHLSATSAFDLAIVVFGAMEINKAVAPCMSELIKTRLQEKKPIWIYLTEIFSPKTQEYTDDLANILTNEFEKLTVKSNNILQSNEISGSKRLASQF